ncbi:type II toxin-antitoxin system RelE/ParE family toxin [Burkholderia gladioli]|uniref:type II toxin-antitoxin system RelE/ParE family toxin n=1 Tax=Burkholderia gladioli TaxID=28095 RepID=UPI0016405DA1|nr:type II toxin-antitoxin system RelE/ParE family toxin [Burkholderia gladioli]
MKKRQTLRVKFFRTSGGNEPVLEWLKKLDAADKKAIGTEIKTVELGWPIGMPVVRKIRKDLWEVRVTLHKRIARIIFTVSGSEMVLLHGFIKKQQALAKQDIDLAEERLKETLQVRPKRE